MLSWEEDQDCFCVELIESFVTEIMEPGLTLVHVVSFGLHRGGGLIGCCSDGSEASAVPATDPFLITGAA